MIQFHSQNLYDLQSAEKHEWLVTNGIGGYASGTVAGLLTRRYHGLLIAALNPPVERTLLVSKVNETITYKKKSTPLFADRWSPVSVSPDGYSYIESFELQGTIPVWVFCVADARIEKRIWMQPGENTTYVDYQVLEAGEFIEMNFDILVNYRDHHKNTKSQDFEVSKDQQASDTLHLNYQDYPTTLTIKSFNAELIPAQEWKRGYWHSMEDYRGLPPLDDNLLAARASAFLNSGSSLALVFSSEPSPKLDPKKALKQFKENGKKVLDAKGGLGKKVLNKETANQLALAADQFIVERSGEQDSNNGGKTVIAGYHWFSDWGRDTMIALPGLTLVTGRYQLAADILRTFNKYIDQGMLPNRFPDIGQTPEYNTVDATLWFFEAVRTYYEFTDDLNLVSDLYSSLEDIIFWHNKGTRYNIHVDPQDGLVYAGEEGVQLTWMDAKVDDWVVTPRVGKPVEINALWYNALRSMVDFAALLGKPQQEYLDLAEKVKSSFERFWNQSLGYCYDVLDTPNGDDPRLRPNQIFAVSLHNSPLVYHHQKAVVDTCTNYLLTPFGLRSLSPHDKENIGFYGGDRYQRDAAYHQGTVWGWLIGPYIQAHLKVYGDTKQVQDILNKFTSQLFEFGVGSIGEVFDGDAPHEPKGCIAQAWSVAEALRAAYLIEKFKSE